MVSRCRGKLIQPHCTWEGTSVLHVGVLFLPDLCWDVPNHVWSSWVLQRYPLHSVSGPPGLWRIMLGPRANDHEPCRYSDGEVPALSSLLFLTPGLFQSTYPFFTLASPTRLCENLKSPLQPSRTRYTISPLYPRCHFYSTVATLCWYGTPLDPLQEL